MPPKTIVFGMDGFLGCHFYEAYKTFHPDTVGTSHKMVGKNFFLDLAQIDVSILPLEEFGYTDAIITAGITKLSRCEDEKEYTRKINVDGILELARRISEAGLKVIWFSSDYVFNGRSGNYSESSPTHPINEYGRQKAEVERRLSKICKGNVLIVRLSKVFGLKKGDGSLIDEMADKLTGGEKVNAAYDQFFCPTLVDDVVHVVFQLQSRSVIGLVNLCNPRMWSRYDLAIQVCSALNLDGVQVNPISLDDLNEKFERPKRTNMICNRLISIGLNNFTPIQYCIQSFVHQYLYKSDKVLLR